MALTVIYIPGNHPCRQNLEMRFSANYDEYIEKFVHVSSEYLTFSDKHGWSNFIYIVYTVPS